MWPTLLSTSLVAADLWGREGVAGGKDLSFW